MFRQLRQISIIFSLKISITLCFKLTILHTNDIHGRFEEIDSRGFICERIKGACFGGVARIATVVKDARKKERNVVFVDGGDRFTGTIWSDVYEGNASLVFFNALNYTAITLGNHDFDYGVKTLLRFLEQIKSPVVVSNINTNEEPLWPDDKKLVRNTTIVDVGGERVGFVGYITPYTTRSSNPGKNIKFLPIISSVQKAVDELISKGINKIIAVGHAGFQYDKEVAKKVVGVDVVVGGHSNTFLYTGNPPSDDKCQGPYPFVVHPEHNTNLSVPVVQAYYYSKYLGKLQVTFNDAGEVTAWSGNPVLLSSTVPKDQQVYDIVKKMKVLVDKKGNEKIGQIKRKIDSTSCDIGPCFFGELVTSAMIYHYRSYNVTTSMLHHTAVLTSLHTDSQGYILYKDLFESFPYRNTIDMIELSGLDLKNCIEHAAKSGYPQVQGLAVRYSKGKPPQVESLQIKQKPCSTGISKCYVQVNMSKTYKVVFDSYFVFQYINTTKETINRTKGKTIYDVLAEYFKAKYPVNNDVINVAGVLTYDIVTFLSVLLATLWLLYN
ncbi:5'-nucleotidase-like [Dendronephthya gigantea]|uniref:5'-nucleotidase-like n=1 Tax=Dendronephthya gigantea TaxID=151771 RepID=UPI00106DB48D|nr:5'-nucleotidase-like [Dendronephthya gigantea]